MIKYRKKLSKSIAWKYDKRNKVKMSDFSVFVCKIFVFFFCVLNNNRYLFEIRDIDGIEESG